MANLGKILSIRITTKQSKYLSKLAETTHKPFSDLIRDIIQQHMERQNAKPKLSSQLVFTVKTYQLLKQFLRTYHEQAEATINVAETTAADILEIIGQDD